MRTLLRGGRVYTGASRPQHTCVLIEDGQIVATGDDRLAEAADGAEEVVDLEGGWVAPAFVDAHVHTVQAGFLTTQLDVTGSVSLTDCLDQLAAQAAAADPGVVVVGCGWDETAWADGRPPTGEELARAAGDRPVLLTRIDGHSAVVSPALAALVPGLGEAPGATSDGRVERQAAALVTQALADLVGAPQRLAAARAACQAMARAGIVAFHDNAAPHIGPDYEIALVRQAAEEVGLRATLYWGELADDETLAKATRLGVAGLAGDLNVDGAIGSRTAALCTPYDDSPGRHGHTFLTADQIADHLVACTRAGIQGGFHCIGEAGMETLADGFELSAKHLGDDVLVAARHRVEHAEMPSPHVIETLARLGVVASVQPVFDALWGGPRGMYAERLGARWRAMNPLRSLESASVRLAFGSDAPVTPFGPWEAVRAAVHHRTPEESLTPTQAFGAHTRGGAYAARDDLGGRLGQGARADLAVWDVAGPLAADGLPDLSSEAPLPRLSRLLSEGRTIVLDGEPTHAEVTL